MLSKKLIIIIAAAVVVLGGGGAGGFIVMKKRKAAAEAAKAQAEQGKGAEGHGSEEEEDEAGAEGGGHGGDSGTPVMVVKHIVNLQGQAKNAYLKCEIDVIFRDAELAKLAGSDKPTAENSTIRAMVLSAISQISLEEASDPETREALRNEIKEQLNEKFAPKPLKPGEKEDPKHKKPKHPIKDVLVVDWAISR